MGLLTNLLDEHMQAKHAQERQNTNLQSEGLQRIIGDSTVPWDRRYNAMGQLVQLTPQGKGKNGNILQSVFGKMLGIHPDQNKGSGVQGLAGGDTSGNNGQAWDDSSGSAPAPPYTQSASAPGAPSAGGGGRALFKPYAAEEDPSSPPVSGQGTQPIPTSSTATPVSPEPQQAQSQQSTFDSSSPDNTPESAPGKYIPVQHPSGEIHAIQSPVDSTGQLQASAPTPLPQRSQPAFSPYSPEGLADEQQRHAAYMQQEAKNQTGLYDQTEQAKFGTEQTIATKRAQIMEQRLQIFTAAHPNVPMLTAMEAVGYPVKGTAATKLISGMKNPNNPNEIGTGVLDAATGKMIDFHAGMKPSAANAGLAEAYDTLQQWANRPNASEDDVVPASVKAANPIVDRFQSGTDLKQNQADLATARKPLLEAQARKAGAEAQIYSGMVAGTDVASNSSEPSLVATATEDVLSGRLSIKKVRENFDSRGGPMAGMLAKQVYVAVKKIDPAFPVGASDAGQVFQSSAFYNRAVASIKSVKPNIDKLIQLSDEVDRAGILKVDQILQGAKAQFNDKKVANFQQAATLVADEIGTALGAGMMTDQKLQLALHIVKTTQDKEVFKANMEILKGFLDRREDGLNSQAKVVSTTRPQPQATSTQTQSMPKSPTKKVYNGITYTIE